MIVTAVTKSAASHGVSVQSRRIWRLAGKKTRPAGGILRVGLLIAGKQDRSGSVLNDRNQAFSCWVAISFGLGLLSPAIGVLQSARTPLSAMTLDHFAVSTSI